MAGLFPILCGAAVPLACARACGRLIPLKTEHPGIALELAVGAPLLSTYYLALMLTGIGYWPLMAAPLLLYARGLPRPAWTLPSASLLLLAPYFVYYAVHALAPEIQPDAVTYHLGLVREWVRLGRMPDRVGHFEIMPHGFEMLYAAAYSIGHHSAAKLVHLAFLAATAPLIIAIARRMGFDGFPAAAIYLFTPVVGVSGTSALVDPALAFFAAATFYLLLEDQCEAAGITAGFCYAVKMTGGVFLAAAVLYMLYRRRWKAVAWALAIPLPWIARAWWLAGNPVAPLFNSWFPNPHFHWNTEQLLLGHVSNYGVPWLEMPWEITMSGLRSQGLLGPLFLLAPLALISLRSRNGRLLWAAAMITAVPWCWNAGTRFLIPPLIFVSMALCLCLPRRLALCLALLHGLACWPAVMKLYMAPSWRLEGFPWRAALRLEPEPVYLKSALHSYRFVDLLSKVPPGQKVLDLVDAPQADTDTPLAVHWQHAGANRALDALFQGFRRERHYRFDRAARWPPQPLLALRIELEKADAPLWSMNEIALLAGGASAFPAEDWELDASPNPWETGLALDRNPTTRWQSWRPAARGMFYEIRFRRPVQADGVRILSPAGERSHKIALRAMDASGVWRGLPAPGNEPTVALDFRRRSTVYLKREGFRFVLVRNGPEFSGLAADLAGHPGDWNLQSAGQADNVFLLRIP